MVSEVEVCSATRYVLNGRERQVAEEQGAPKTDGRAMITALSSVFYASFYCRPIPIGDQRFDAGAGRDLGAALSRANCGSGTWDPGWRVRDVEPDGRIAVQRDGLTVYAGPSQFRPQEGAVEAGKVGRLRVGKELLGASPGFYLALGDGDQDDSRHGASPTVRIYWNLKSEGAVPFVEGVTRVFNRAKVPFRAKTLSHPRAYARADAAVLYLDKRFYRRVRLDLVHLHDRLRRFLRAESPSFTKELARGVGLAEDPQSGESFGQHRCRLVALGVWRCYERGVTDRSARRDGVLAAFREAGLDPERPHLAAATAVDDYSRLDETIPADPHLAFEGCSDQPCDSRDSARARAGR